MEIKQVAAFLAVSRSLSFGRAAEELSFSPSALSKQIAALEKELDCRLFHRKGSSQVTLTEMGEQLRPDMLQIYSSYQQIQIRLQANKTAGAGQGLTFSYPPSLSAIKEELLIHQFRERYPEIPLRHVVLAGREVVSALISGKIDACLFITMDDTFERMLQEYHVDPGQVSHLSLLPTKLCVVLGEDHPQAQGDQVELPDLREEAFLFRRYYEGVQYKAANLAWRNACREEGFEPKIVYTQEEKDTLLFQGCALGDYAIPVVFPMAVPYPGTKVVPLARQYYSGELRLYYMKDNHSPSLRPFLECARAVYRG